MINLKLQEIAKYCTGISAIDIGADHGYLLIILIQEHNFQKVLGIDVNVGPLTTCRNNLQQYEKKAVIGCKLSDGLQEVEKGQSAEYDSIVIAGMGGNLIIDILKKDLEKFKWATLVLQPNNNESKLRSFLSLNGFGIIKEKIILENDIFYSILQVKFQSEAEIILSPDELMFGKNLENENNFIDKWVQKLEYIEKLQLELEQKKNKISN